MISSPFPHHTIASLRQVGMMGLTPLQENRVEILHLFRWFTHTHNSLTTCSHTTFSHRTLSPDLSSTISFLSPAFPILSSPFFCYLLEEVDMWGYPVLYCLASSPNLADLPISHGSGDLPAMETESTGRRQSPRAPSLSWIGSVA